MRSASLVAALALAGLAHAGPVASAHYPEGPLWRGGGLLYAEMGADRISRRGPGGAASVLWSEPGCGPTSLAPWGAGLVVLCHRSASVVALDDRLGVARRWRQASDGARLQNPNDSSADDAGGVYISDPGVFAAEAPVTGAVLHLGADGVLRRVAGDLHYPNGVFFDAEEKALYVSEHLARRILRFPVLEGGALGRPETFARIARDADRAGAYAEAGPDGLERGPDGDLYVCVYGEGRVVRLTSDGRVRAVITVPMRYVTNIAFAPGGTAYVTGAYDNLRPPFPGAVVALAPEKLGGSR